MMPDVVAVIVTYNRVDKLVHAFESIASQDVLAIIIVNNGSTDGTREWLATLDDERLKVVNLEQNLGGAGGFNRGFALAAEIDGAAWVLCYDDDAYADAALLQHFSELPLGDDVGGVATAVYHTNGAMSEMNRPSYHPFGSFGRAMRTLFRGGAGFHIDDACYASKTPVDIDCSSFVGLFVRTALVRGEVGLPDAKLFIYADDILYTWSIREAGYRLLFVPQLEFVHDCKSVEEGRKKYSPLWKVYYTYRNGLVLYRKFSGAYFPAILLAKLAAWTLAARHYERRDVGRYFRYMRTAVVDYFRDRYDRPHEEVVALGDASERARS